MTPTIKKGSNNKWVKVAKYLTGYSSAGKATGSFDSKFRSFVIKWQTQYGLTADGIIGDKTWTKIASESPTISETTKTAIYAFQIATGLSANGSYNTATKNLIINIQKGCGYKETGVCDAKVWKEVIALIPKQHKHTVNYKQNDKRWGKIIYSITNSKSQTIESSGCAPTSAASIVATLKDSSIVPEDMCKLAIEKGCRRKTGGTDGKFFSYVGEKYKFKAVIETTNTMLFKHCLDKGGYVVCAFKAGSWWTSCGHYSPCWAYDSKYFYVDNTISKIKIKRGIDKLSKDCRAFYLMYP